MDQDKGILELDDVMLLNLKNGSKHEMIMSWDLLDNVATYSTGYVFTVKNHDRVKSLEGPLVGYINETKQHVTVSFDERLDGISILLRTRNNEKLDIEKFTEFWVLVGQEGKSIFKNKLTTMEEEKVIGLPYAEAEAEMKRGEPIALPEWGGFWFYSNKQTFVFTKDDLFLNTPDFDQYTPREDWIVPAVDSGLAIRMIKALRVSMDAYNSNLNPLIKNSRETSLVKTELQLAFMWLGYLLNEIGAINPYPQSMNVNSPAIEKHADIAEDDQVDKLINIEDLLAIDETARVKHYRVQVAMYIDSVYWLLRCVLPKFTLMKDSQARIENQVIVHLMNTKLWLGQCLNNIRVREEGK